MELFAEIHLHMTFQKHSQGSDEGRQMELLGHTLSTSDPVQQDSLKDWRLKTSPLKKSTKTQLVALWEVFFPCIFGRLVVFPAMGPSLGGQKQ